MKKFFLMLCFMVCGLVAQAQNYQFYTYQFSYRVVDNGEWTDWSDWQDSRMLVSINADNDVISIQSADPQRYQVLELGELEEDGEGTSQEFLCVNEDNVRCNIRLRIQNDGIKQLYVDFADAMWVYSLE